MTVIVSMNLLLLFLLVPCLPDDQVNWRMLKLIYCSCSGFAHSLAKGYAGSCYFTLILSIHQDVFSSSAELASLARLDIFLQYTCQKCSQKTVS